MYHSGFHLTCATRKEGPLVIGGKNMWATLAFCANPTAPLLSSPRPPNVFNLNNPCARRNADNGNYAGESIFPCSALLSAASDTADHGRHNESRTPVGPRFSSSSHHDARVGAGGVDHGDAACAHTNCEGRNRAGNAWNDDDSSRHPCQSRPRSRSSSTTS